MTRFTNRFDGIVGKENYSDGSSIVTASLFMNQKIEYVTTEEEKKAVFHHLSKDDLKELIKEAERLISVIEKNED